MTPDTTTLHAEVRALLHAARAAAARQVNTLLVLTNFQIGRSIVEHEQGGDERAEYGAAVLATLSQQLTQEFGRGFSVDNLTLMRRFYLAYRDRLPISETPSRILSGAAAGTPESAVVALNHAPGVQPNRPFTLSWSHYVYLMGIKDEAARSFYEVESTRGHWSLKELRRQFDSALFERLALSRDKDAVVEITLPQGANIHAREYTLALPSAEELRRKLLEWTEEP